MSPVGVIDGCKEKQRQSKAGNQSLGVCYCVWETRESSGEGWRQKNGVSTCDYS